MSNVSTAHDVVPFVSGETKALADQRLARVLYKPSKKTPQKFPSVAVSVPKVTADIWNTPAILDRLTAHINAMVETAQDGVIKSLYESSQGSLKIVTDADISIDAVIGYLEAEAIGARITNAAIEQWFENEVRENLSVVVAEKLKFEDITEENSPTINKHVGVYKELLSSLAGGKTFLTPVQIKGCRNAIALANNEDEMSSKLSKRLDSMENKPKVEDLLEL